MDFDLLNRVCIPGKPQGGHALLRLAQCGKEAQPMGTQTPACTAGATPNLHADERPSPTVAKNDDRELLKALLNSNIFAAYQRAFRGATGLPIALQPVDSFMLPKHGRGHENPFCALLAQKGRSCGECLSFQASVKFAARYSPQAAVCRAGLSEIAVPIRLGNRLLGYLQAVPGFRRTPTERQFQQALRWLKSMDLVFDWEELRKAYFGTRVYSSGKQASVIQLLKIFAQHLSILSNQVCIQRDNAEPPWAKKAKEVIGEHYAEGLRLADVANCVNMSPCHFCKMFKRTTALTFTGYVARVRVERCKQLLLNPNLRVSEIAYEVGFQSVTHFNRVFRKIAGQSPSEFRFGREAGAGDRNRRLAPKRFGAELAVNSSGSFFERSRFGPPASERHPAYCSQRRNSLRAL